MPNEEQILVSLFLACGFGCSSMLAAMTSLLNICGLLHPTFFDSSFVSLILLFYWRFCFECLADLFFLSSGTITEHELPCLSATSMIALEEQKGDCSELPIEIPLILYKS